MARQSKQTNGIDAKVASDFIARVENLHDDLKSMKGTYMNECKGVREDIKEVYSEAKEAGIPVKALKAEIKTRQLDRRKEEIKAGLDIDEMSAFEQLQEALGGLADLPLGKQALEQAQAG